MPPTRAMFTLCLVALLAQSVRADPLRLVLGTATPGGGFPAYGAALASAIHEVDPDLTLETRATGGSAENVGLLRAGSVDLALVQGEFAYPALAAKVAPRLTVVAPMYATPGLLVVAAASPVRTLADLAGKPVALGTRNSGLTAMGRAVLTASGLDPERDVVPILLAHAGDGPALVADGRAAGLWGGGIGWPGFMAVAALPGGARFVGPAPEAIDRALAASPSLRRMTVPAGSFRGQDAAIDTVGSWSLVLARPGLDPEAAHRLVAAIDRAGADLARRLPQGRDSDPRNLSGAVPAENLNPGTARYLREVGAAR
ncbi:TAXI family TRAP transporter solute-binding subunit [Methylobacterium sp. WL120]|uniref:TAXI family TRAP transporter solute-binding subunit n=2 Tax=unclassified Methylobacterium TaxID=2615210 RepID=UPI0011C84352|nr:TAXI family TRAP transporter solute-binding subunit [Methylobacterium sp. WL120]TXM64874.1 TAXI family TRAP transporter solute-binding subunit [Methylobacterium sp. WL120]